MNKSFIIIDKEDSVSILMPVSDRLQFVSFVVLVFIFFVFGFTIFKSCIMSEFAAFIFLFAFPIALLSVIKKFYNYSYEEMVLIDNKIIIHSYLLPFLFRSRAINIENSVQTQIHYQDTTKRSGHSILVEYIFKPIRLKGIILKNSKREYGIGLLLTKPDYEEILTLILAQREKWEKEQMTTVKN